MDLRAKRIAASKAIPVRTRADSEGNRDVKPQVAKNSETKPPKDDASKNDSHTQNDDISSLISKGSNLSLRIANSVNKSSNLEQIASSFTEMNKTKHKFKKLPSYIFESKV